jgi:hypothetical protein
METSLRMNFCPLVLFRRFTPIILLLVATSPLWAQTPPVEKPFILLQMPESLTVVQGSSANQLPGGKLGLEVHFGGSIFSTAQWTKNGLPIGPVIPSPNYSGIVSYLLPSAQLEDSGDYAVTITNSAGSVTSTTCHLTVVEKIIITSPPVPRTATPGGTCFFPWPPPAPRPSRINGTDRAFSSPAPPTPP